MNEQQIIINNGLNTSAIIKNDRIYMRIKCQTHNGNLEVCEVPHEFGMFWFPLVPHFDYAFVQAFGKILLKVDPQADKKLRNKFGDPHHPKMLSNFYDYKNDKPGTDLDMYDLNRAITIKLKSMGLKTWDGFYNLQDVSYNNEMLNNSLDSLERDVIRRYENNSEMKVKVSHNPLDYLTKEEEKYLADLGFGFQMNSYMRKVANRMYLRSAR